MNRVECSRSGAGDDAVLVVMVLKSVLDELFDDENSFLSVLPKLDLPLLFFSGVCAADAVCVLRRAPLDDALIES